MKNIISKCSFLLFVLSAAINLHAATGTCSASNQIEFKKCLDMAQGYSSISRINISTTISCSGSSCNFTVNNVANKLTISGTSSNSGIKRTAGYTVPLLTIKNSKNVTIDSLLIDDNNNVSSDTQIASSSLCPPSAPSCASTVSVSSSSNIILNNVQINGSKQFGVSVVGTTGIQILNSTIKDSWLYGIWFSKNYPSFDIKIDNNKFIKNRSNAILFLGKTKALDVNTISKNTFSGNHYNSAFFVCGKGTEPCSGGQLLIESGTDKLIIDSNSIKDGSMINSQYTSGIEFATSDISNIKISNNTIANNTGYGIVKNESTLPPLTNITIVKNIFNQNNLGNIVFPEANITDLSKVDCLFNNVLVINGNKITAYSTSTVPYGQNCQREERICTNGVLSGSYPQSSCTVSPQTIPLKISAGGIVTSYDPYVVWLSVSGAVPNTAINLYANGIYWGKGTGVALNNGSMSFSLPSNVAINNCNVNRSDCILMVELQNLTTGEKSQGFNIRLPSVSLPTTPSSLQITAGGIVMTYNPYVVWLNVKGANSGTVVNLYANGVYWGKGSDIALSNGSMSFSLPSNAAINNCNVNHSDCTLKVELANPSTGEKSSPFSLILPSVTAP